MLLSRPENTPTSTAAPGSRTFYLSRNHRYCHLDRPFAGWWPSGSLHPGFQLSVSYFLSLFSARAPEPLSTYHLFLSMFSQDLHAASSHRGRHSDGVFERTRVTRKHEEMQTGHTCPSSQLMEAGILPSLMGQTCLEWELQTQSSRECEV